MNTEAMTPSSVEGPGGICWTEGEGELRFLIMVIESGLMPELAVTAVLPSGLRVRPKGCGATVMVLPRGVRSRPLGITVVPLGSGFVYLSPAGAEAIHGAGSFLVQPKINKHTKIAIKILFFIVKL